MKKSVITPPKMINLLTIWYRLNGSTELKLITSFVTATFCINGCRGGNYVGGIRTVIGHQRTLSYLTYKCCVTNRSRTRVTSTFGNPIFRHTNIPTSLHIIRQSSYEYGSVLVRTKGRLQNFFYRWRVLCIFCKIIHFGTS